MKEFLIFHSSSNSPRMRVERYRRVARQHAADAGLEVAIMAVDVDRSHPNNQRRQTNRVIECTTAIDGNVRDTEVNPSDAAVGELVKGLK